MLTIALTVLILVFAILSVVGMAVLILSDDIESRILALLMLITAISLFVAGEDYREMWLIINAQENE